MNRSRETAMIEQQRWDAMDILQSTATTGHVYETVAKFLIVNRFHLTALEFYTELLELGHDLLCLREFFSDSTHFENSNIASSNKSTSWAQSGYHQNGDSKSLLGGNEDCLSRMLNTEFFDTTSVDNLTIYSKDVDQFQNGSTEANLYEERLTLLGWELKKARQTIAELRQALSTEQNQEEDPIVSSVESKENDQSTPSTPDRIDMNGGSNLHPVSSSRSYMNDRSESSTSSSEHRTLNYLINQYLFNNNYKLTSVTFAEENESIDLDGWNGMTSENISLPDLIHLYRWYCYQLHLNAHKPTSKDVSVEVNMDASLANDYQHLQNLFQQTQADLIESNKHIERNDDEKLQMKQQISTLTHDNRNLLIRVEQSSGLNAPTLDATTDDVWQAKCFRQVPSSYRLVFERKALLQRYASEQRDEQSSESQSLEQEVLNELDQLSLDQPALLELIQRTILKCHAAIPEPQKLFLIPLLICTSILRTKSDDGEHLLTVLFNLFDKPTHRQRQVISNACVYFARQTGSVRIRTELLPRLWENLNHAFDQRRCLVLETCARLTCYLPLDVRNSSLFCMFRQILIDDVSDQIRSVCCRSLAVLILDMDDSSRLPQCFDLLDQCLADTPDVMKSAREYLLPSIAMWCLDSNNIFSLLIEHYLTRVESFIQDTHVDHRHILQSLAILTDLLVFVLASILKNISITDHSASNTLSARALPDAKSAEIYQLRLILFPNGEKLLNIYDECANTGDFPITEPIRTALDQFLTRVFDAMALIDVRNQTLVSGCSKFIRTLSRYLGRNFWQLKIKPIYAATLSTVEVAQQALFALYATGTLCAWTTEQEEAELTEYLYEALRLVANHKLSIDTLVVIYAEIGSNRHFEDHLLNVLRDSLTNTNPHVRLCIVQLFNSVLPFVDHLKISSKILPAMITLASDDHLSVRTATIPVFGSILVQCTESEILQRVYSQFQIFDSDVAFRDDHHVQAEFIRTFARIASYAEAKFREDFILPFLAFIVAQSVQENIDQSQAKRLEIITYLFEAYSALSCVSHSDQSILNSFLPGLYCLRMDFAQHRPDSLPILDSIIQDLENQLERNAFVPNHLNLHQENARGRMLKGFTNLRDSTGKLTHRWMKRK